jgi:hypothetical protein
MAAVLSSSNIKPCPHTHAPSPLLPHLALLQDLLCPEVHEAGGLRAAAHALLAALRGHLQHADDVAAALEAVCARSGWVGGWVSEWVSRKGVAVASVCVCWAFM